MKHAKIPLVTAGGDWAGVMNIHAGQIGNGVVHHGVEQTRARLRLASIMFVGVPIKVAVPPIEAAYAIDNNKGIAKLLFSTFF